MALLIVLSALTSAVAQVPDSMTRVVPGERAGPVRPTSTAAELVALLGADAQRAPVELGEGFTEPGLVLFPDDSTRRAFVYWRDTSGLTQPRRLFIMGTTTRWSLPLGLTIGTTLEELERLNGQAFTFAGLDWDYGGVVGSWEGGALDGVLGRGMELRVTLFADCADRVGGAYREIVGDIMVASTHSVARRACLRVSQIWIDFTLP